MKIIILKDKEIKSLIEDKINYESNLKIKNYQEIEIQTEQI